MTIYYFKMRAINLKTGEKRVYAYEVSYSSKDMFLAELDEWNKIAILTDKIIYTYCEISQSEFLNIKYKGR